MKTIDCISNKIDSIIMEVISRTGHHGIEDPPIGINSKGHNNKRAHITTEDPYREHNSGQHLYTPKPQRPKFKKALFNAYYIPVQNRYTPIQDDTQYPGEGHTDVTTLGTPRRAY